MVLAVVDLKALEDCPNECHCLVIGTKNDVAICFPRLNTQYNAYAGWRVVPNVSHTRTPSTMHMLVGVWCPMPVTHRFE